MSGVSLVLCCLLVSAVIVIGQETGITQQEAVAYLKGYGYMGPNNPDKKVAELTDTQAMPMALKNFQEMAGLPVTGVLDDATKAKMEMPRCGVRDVNSVEDNGYSMSKRKKRYALQGSKWDKTQLTYRISRYTSDMSRSNVDREIRRAFDVWEMVTPLRFTQRSPGQRVDIDILFAPGEHGDGSPFDGPGRTLAHAFFPQYGGDSHFDEAETWTLNTRSGTNLFQVAAHEFGHALGLSHSNVNQALMAPFYTGYQPNFNLHQDDIDGIQAIYGGPTPGGRSTTLPPPNPPPTTRRPNPPRTTRRTNRPPPTTTPTVELTPDLRAVCEAGRVDAFTKHEINGQIRQYAFYKNLYMRIGSQGIDEGYPRRISDGWPGLPNDIDAALYLDRKYHSRWTWNGRRWTYTTTQIAPRRTYFFKGSLYWRFENGRMLAGYPKSIGVWGLPSNIDAAYTWSQNGRIYFVKGSQYYRLNKAHNYIDSGYPRPLSVWDRSLRSVDAAIMTSQTNSRYTYFFVNNQYYRYNDRAFRLDAQYPRSTSRQWFGCDRFQNLLDDNSVGDGASTLSISILLSTVFSVFVSTFVL